MYLGDERLISLSCYVAGVFDGLELAGAKSTAERRFLADFGNWLAGRLDVNGSDCWFCLQQCLPDRTGHVDDFYRELDRFLRERGFERGLDDERLDLGEWEKLTIGR